MAENNRTAEKYFAAANSYRGFISYFDRIFNPADYERIYVLKGGPGTGKSTFMRRLSEQLAGCGCHTENIHCSSDTHSLDGVIAESGNKRVAVLDGTSPHERDAQLPGAFDEIINLGKAWDTRWLYCQRDKILSLNKGKKEAYATAYSYLSVAGSADKFISAQKLIGCNAKNLKNDTKILAESLKCSKKGACAVRLISAFGRDGAVTLDTVEGLADRVYNISCGEYESRYYLTFLLDALKDMEIKLTYFPNALNEDLIDAIYIPEISAAFVACDKEDVSQREKYFTCSDVVRERCKCAERIRRDALSEAERFFAIASVIHFELEEIYKATMDFDAIDRMYTEKSKEICEILE